MQHDPAFGLDLQLERELHIAQHIEEDLWVELFAHLHQVLTCRSLVEPAFLNVSEHFDIVIDAVVEPFLNPSVIVGADADKDEQKDDDDYDELEKR